MFDISTRQTKSADNFHQTKGEISELQIWSVGKGAFSQGKSFAILVICTVATHCNSAKHMRHPGQDSVDSTFSMKMLVNCAHIWSVDLVQFQDDAAGAILFKVPSFGILVGDGR